MSTALRPMKPVRGQQDASSELPTRLPLGALLTPALPGADVCKSEVEEAGEGAGGSSRGKVPDESQDQGWKASNKISASEWATRQTVGDGEVTVESSVGLSLAEAWEGAGRKSKGRNNRSQRGREGRGGCHFVLGEMKKPDEC